ncbi:MAG TPA: tetratricopeptide repeat protein [Gemmataceae bacterium]|nr:tetratricopeptide repeat protein [Gemmataceae bacterium]
MKYSLLAVRPARRGLLIAALLAGLMLAAVLAGAWWIETRRLPAAAAPVPPQPSPSDPDVAVGFAAARQQVLQEPHSAAAWGAYGEVLLANDYHAEAAACLMQAEKLDPADPRWPYLRGWDAASTDRSAALAALRRAAELSDRAAAASPAPWLLLAELYVESDDREQVEACCRRVFEREPDNARAHFALGMIAFQHDDLDVCIPHLLLAAKSPAVHRRACTQLAAAYQRKKDETNAAQYAQLAQQAPPDEPWNDPYLAPLDALKMGAETRFRPVKELGSKGLLAKQAELLRHMAVDDHDERANLDLGIILTEMGEFDEAEGLLQKAAGSYSQSADPFYFLGVERYQKGEKTEARDRKQAADLFQASADATDQATQRKPDHAMAHYYHGLALEKLGRRSEAIAALRTAARCRPEVVDIQLDLGKALAEDGRHAEAEAHLRQACDLAPDDARPRDALAKLRTAP